RGVLAPRPWGLRGAPAMQPAGLCRGRFLFFVFANTDVRGSVPLASDLRAYLRNTVLWNAASRCGLDRGAACFELPVGPLPHGDFFVLTLFVDRHYSPTVSTGRARRMTSWKVRKPRLRRRSNR